MELLEILGEEYYLDIENISSSIKLKTTIEDLLESDEELEETLDDNGDSEGVIRYNKSDLIDMTKWEIIKTCIEVVFNENEIPDDGLGIKGSKHLSLPFKLAFNTLIKNKIIKKNG
jgi:hypothetical protein